MSVGSVKAHCRLGLTAHSIFIEAFQFRNRLQSENDNFLKKVDIKELRRRRNEREQNEEQREKELLTAASRAIKGDRERPYQNQYFPHLNRQF